MTLPTPGPDPRPEPVSPAPPPGGWDCHAHIFGPSDRFPYAEGRGYTPPDAPPAHFLRHLDALGLARGVVVQANAHGLDNRAMLAALAAAPERLRGVAITPAGTDAATLRGWHEAGVRGLRFHLFHPEHRPDYRRGVGWDAVEALLPTLLELGWHAQFWADARALPAEEERLARLAARLPVVFDHFGESDARQGPEAPGFRALLRLVGEHGAWAKLSAPYRVSLQGPDYADARSLHEAVLRAAPERVVWGSDWPHPQIPAERMPNDGRLLNLLLAWTPDPADRERVLVRNPERLYAG
ncbi:amidohydrolase [Roseomonas sp. M0104]|uniref:Amidohydrolase n=1 Tax=Teichococcus coralli TaxID=2545983 RepID=A0A845BBR9_9PROT|nr:amidohydrolase [Pseudoroseomonas coralli]